MRKTTTQKLFIIFLTNVIALLISTIATGDANYNIFLNFRYPAHTWIGHGTDSNWSNLDNWSDKTLPGPNDVVNFTGSCYQSVARCSAVIDTNVTIAGINIESTWLATSTITANAGVNITLSGAYTQPVNTVDFTNAASVSIGGTSTISAGTFTLSGGTNSLSIFSGSGGTVNLAGTTNFTSTVVINGTTMNANAATVTTTGLFTLTTGSYVSTTGSGTFNGGITKTGGTFTGGSTAGSTMAVTGVTTISGTGNFSTAQNTSTFTGNVGYSSSGTFTTNGTTTLAGASTLTTSAGTFTVAGAFNVGGTWTASGSTITTTTNTVTVSGLFSLTGGSYTSTSGINNFNGGFSQGTAATSFVAGSSTNVVGSTGFTFNIGAGAAAGPTFNGGSGNWTVNGPLTLSGTWNATSCAAAPCFRFTSATTQISGNINIANLNSAANVSANTGTITLLTTGTQTFTTSGTMFTLRGITFSFGNTTGPNNVSFAGLATLTANGNVTFSAGVGCGANCTVDSAGFLTLIVQNGNIIATGEGAQGALRMNVTGTASSISADTFLPSGLITVTKATAATLVTVSAAAQTTNIIGNMTINTGTITMSGNMTVRPGTTGALIVNNGGSLLCNGNTLTTTSPVINAGGIVDCNGYNFNWTGLAHNSLWSDSGNWSSGTVPTATSSVVFSSAFCTGADCDCIVDVPATMLSLSVYTGYTGTISQGANSLTVGASGINMQAGTVTATTGTFANAGIFIFSGGTWTMGSNANTTTGAFTQSGGTLNTNGTTAFSATFDMTGGTTHQVSGSLAVTGATNLNSTFGNILFDCTAGTLTFTGAFVQTKGPSANTFGSGACASTITFSNTFNMVTGGSTYIGGTGPNIFSGNSVLAGYAAGSTFTATTGKTTFNTTAAALAIRVAGGTAITFADVDLITAGTTTVTLTGTATISGHLNIGDTVATGVFNTGTLNMTGAGAHIVTATGNGYTGTGIINLAPAGGQTTTVTSGPTCPGIQLPAIAVTAGGAGTVVYSGCVRPVNYTFTSAPAVLTVAGSTLNFTRTATYTSTVNHNVENVTFTGNNLVHTLAGAGSMNVTGNLNLDGTGTTTFAGAATINASGDINVTNLGMPQTAGTNTVINVTGATPKTIFGTATAAGRLPSLTINSAGGVTFSNFMNVTGNYVYTTGVITVTGSTLNFISNGAASTLTDNGTVIYNDVTFAPTAGTTYTLGTSNLRVGGTLSFTQGGGVTATMNGGTITSLNGTTISATTTTYAGTTIVDVTGAALQTLTGNGANPTIPNLNISESNNVTIAGTFSAAGAVTFAPAAAITISGGVLNAGGLLTFAEGSGTYAVTLNGSTINSRGGMTISATSTTYTGSSIVDVTGANTQTITGGGLGLTIPNLTLSGSNTVTFAGTTDVAGAVIFAPTAAITINGATLNSQGLLSFNQGGAGFAVTMTGGTINSRAGTTIASGSASNYRGTTVVRMTGAAAQALTGGGATSLMPSLTVDSTGPITFTGIIAIANNYTYTAAVSLTTTGSTLHFSGNTTSTISDPGTINYNHVTFAPTAAVTYTLTGTTLNVGGLLTFAQGGAGFASTMTGGTIHSLNGMTIGAASASTYRGTTVVRVDGALSQTLTGGGANAAIPNLVIASTGGVITLSGNIALGNNYTYTSGTISAGSSTLTFRKAAAAAINDDGTQNLNNVVFASANASAYTFTGTMSIGGVLTFSNTVASTVTGGTFRIQGSGTAVSYAGTSSAGNDTYVLDISSNAATTISNTSGSTSAVTRGNINVNGTSTLNFAGGGMIFGQGTGSRLTAAGAANTITMNNAIGTVEFQDLVLNGATFNRNAGGNILRVNNATIGAGAFFGGTIL